MDIITDLAGGFVGPGTPSVDNRSGSMGLSTDPPTLYGVGLGPGDPGLVTRRAEEVIRSVPVVMVPFVGASSRAARVVRELDPEAVIVGYPAPMTRDEREREKAYREAARIAEELLEEHGRVAVCNLGDITLYSTFWHLVDRLRLDVRVSLVPGVPAGLLCAARVGRPLVMGDERLLVCTREPPERLLDGVDAVILYKPTERGIRLLLERGFRVYLCRSLGFPEEEVRRVREPERPGYLCTVIALREGEG
jgi:precorrin-2/cobalt-factor-2 C20-methyltransferase